MNKRTTQNVFYSIIILRPISRLLYLSPSLSVSLSVSLCLSLFLEEGSQTSSVDVMLVRGMLTCDTDTDRCSVLGCYDVLVAAVTEITESLCKGSISVPD